MSKKLTGRQLDFKAQAINMMFIKVASAIPPRSTLEVNKSYQELSWST